MHHVGTLAFLISCLIAIIVSRNTGAASDRLSAKKGRKRLDRSTVKLCIVTSQSLP